MQPRFRHIVRVLSPPLVALITIVSLQHGTLAQQSLTLGLFERNLEQLRQDTGIPGLSAAIVQGRRVVWARGLGMADLERFIPAREDTPYPIGDLTQTFAATLVLRRVEEGRLELSDRMGRWETPLPDSEATVRQVLMHMSTGVFRYDPSRFAALTPVVEYVYGRLPFRKALANEILHYLGMFDSVPGHDLEQPPAVDLPFFEQADLDRYAALVRRMAVPYSVDTRRRPTRSAYPPRGITAGTGAISTVLDLAKFDAALDDGDLLKADMTAAMWAPAAAVNGVRVPTGLGWFLQTYNSEPLIWHFGLSVDSFSSLILKVPGRDLTLILLANSDGLSAPFALGGGDVTTSLFARLFLRVFVP